MKCTKCSSGYFLVLDHHDYSYSDITGSVQNYHWQFILPLLFEVFIRKQPSILNTAEIQYKVWTNLKFSIYSSKPVILVLNPMNSRIPSFNIYLNPLMIRSKLQLWRFVKWKPDNLISRIHYCMVSKQSCLVSVIATTVIWTCMVGIWCVIYSLHW